MNSGLLLAANSVFSVFNVLHTHRWHLHRYAATMNTLTHTAADIWSMQWLSQHFTHQEGKDRSVHSLFTDSSANSSCHYGQWSHYNHLAVHTITKLLMFLFCFHCRTCLKYEPMNIILIYIFHHSRAPFQLYKTVPQSQRSLLWHHNNAKHRWSYTVIYFDNTNSSATCLLLRGSTYQAY